MCSDINLMLCSFHLDYGRVVGKTSLQGGLRLGRLAHPDVLDVGPAKDDVLVHLVPGSHGPVSRPVLRPKRPHYISKNQTILCIAGLASTLPLASATVDIWVSMV